MLDVSKMPDECPHCKGTGKHEGDVGSKLKWLRQQTGESQEQCAADIGVSRTSWTNMEANRQEITNEHLRSICRKFGVSADWLLGIS